jgi:hypothetical protein
MRRLLPLLLPVLLAACGTHRTFWGSDEKFTDVPQPLRQAFAGAGQPNFSSLTRAEATASNFVRASVSAVQSAEDDGMATLTERRVNATRDKQTGAIKHYSPCQNTLIVLGGGLLHVGAMGCDGGMWHYVEADDVSGRLFPLSVGNRLSFEVTEKSRSKAGNSDQTWVYPGRVYTIEVIGKQDGYSNGLVSIPGDIYRIRVTQFKKGELSKMSSRSADIVTELLWSDFLRYTVATFYSGGGSDPLHFVSGSRPMADAAGRLVNVTPLSEQAPDDDRLRRLAAEAFESEVLKPAFAQFRLREEQQRAEASHRNAQKKTDRETAGQLLGFAAALAGGMMASQGARTGNSSLVNQGSELLVRGGVAAATGDQEDVTNLTQALVNQPAQGAGAGMAAGSAATAGSGQQFTPQQEEQIAGQLSQRCKADPEYTQHMTACQSNKLSQAPCYRAAAQLCECFLRNDPRDERASDPRVARHHAEWRKCVAENRANADRLR